MTQKAARDCKAQKNYYGTKPNTKIYMSQHTSKLEATDKSTHILSDHASNEMIRKITD